MNGENSIGRGYDRFVDFLKKKKREVDEKMELHIHDLEKLKTKSKIDLKKLNAAISIANIIRKFSFPQIKTQSHDIIERLEGLYQESRFLKESLLIVPIECILYSYSKIARIMHFVSNICEESKRTSNRRGMNRIMSLYERECDKYEVLSYVERDGFVCRKKSNELRVVEPIRINELKFFNELIYSYEDESDDSHHFFFPMKRIIRIKSKSDDEKAGDECFLVKRFFPLGNIQNIFTREQFLEVSDAKILAIQMIRNLERIERYRNLHHHQKLFSHRNFQLENISIDTTRKHHCRIKFSTPGITWLGLLERELSFPKEVSDYKYVHVPFHSLSPELLLGKKESGGLESDVYSFGCLLFQLLIGYHPFEAGVLSKLRNYYVFREIIRGEVNWPQNLSLYEIPEVALDFVTKLIMVDPHERMTSIEQMKNHPWFEDIDWEKQKDYHEINEPQPHEQSRRSCFSSDESGEYYHNMHRTRSGRRGNRFNFSRFGSARTNSDSEFNMLNIEDEDEYRPESHSLKELSGILKSMKEVENEDYEETDFFSFKEYTEEESLDIILRFNRSIDSEYISKKDELERTEFILEEYVVPNEDQIHRTNIKIISSKSIPIPSVFLL